MNDLEKKLLRFVHLKLCTHDTPRYARRKGIGCCVVTFSVGGFSVLNAIAGAMSEVRMGLLVFINQ
jgi:TPP-dependent 2-oxoacid decarboxylase